MEQAKDAAPADSDLEWLQEAMQDAASRPLVLIAGDDSRAASIVSALRGAGRDDIMVVREPVRPVNSDAPPPPERVKQLDSLYRRLGEAKAAFDACIAELEEGAAPFAERIQALEVDKAAAADVCADETGHAAVAQDAIDAVASVAAKRLQDRRADLEVIRAQAARLEDEINVIESERDAKIASFEGARDAASRAAADARALEYKLGVDLEKANADLDAALDTPRSRRLKRAFEATREHIAKIFSRHPELRSAYVLEKAIEDEILRSGYLDRHRAVHAFLSSEKFNTEFKAAVEEAAKTETLRERQILAMMQQMMTASGVDFSDVMISVHISKAGRVVWQLRGATPEARSRALQVVARHQNDVAESKPAA